METIGPWIFLFVMMIITGLILEAGRRTLTMFTRAGEPDVPDFEIPPDDLFEEASQ